MKGKRLDAPERTLAVVTDSQDLQSVIVAALAARPVHEPSLRRGVWAYVSMEREAGLSPAGVMATLERLVEEAEITPVAVSRALLRQVILWCVEAYFSRLGGVKIGSDAGVQVVTAEVEVLL